MGARRGQGGAKAKGQRPERDEIECACGTALGTVLRGVGPEELDDVYCFDCKGIRDESANHALVGLLSGSDYGGHVDDAAEKAYSFADAMLRARVAVLKTAQARVRAGESGEAAQ